MREILFKAKRKENGERAYWDLFGFLKDPNTMKDIIMTVEEWVNGNKIIRETGEISWLDIDKNTICEYTGYQDKNGTKIFEGDIVKYSVDYIHGEKTYICRVDWKPEWGGWALRIIKRYCGSHSLKQNNAENCEVIGNMWDTIELGGLGVQDEQ